MAKFFQVRPVAPHREVPRREALPLPLPISWWDQIARSLPSQSK